MRYVKVSGQEADRARDLVVLVLMGAGVTRFEYSTQKAFDVFAGMPNSDILRKAFLRNEKYVFNCLNEI